MIEKARQWVQQGTFDGLINEVADTLGEIKLEDEVINRARIIELLKGIIPPIVCGIEGEDDASIQSSVEEFIREFLIERRVELIELLSVQHDLRRMDPQEQIGTVHWHIENALWQKRDDLQ